MSQLAALIITSASSVNDTPTFAGTAEPGSAIVVKVDGVTNW